MKKRIYRVLSVALTAMLLTGMIVGLVATPAAAQTGNQWTKYPTPVSGAAGNWVMSPLITALGPLDIAFDGTALFCGAVFNGAAYSLPDIGDAFVITGAAGSAGTIVVNTGGASVIKPAGGTLTGTGSPTNPWKFTLAAGTDSFIVIANAAATAGYWTRTAGTTAAAAGYADGSGFNLPDPGDAFTLTVPLPATGSYTGAVVASAAAKISVVGTGVTVTAADPVFTWTTTTGGTIVVTNITLGTTAGAATGGWEGQGGTTAAITADTKFSLPVVGDAFALTVGTAATGTVTAAAAGTVTVVGGTGVTIGGADPNFTFSGAGTADVTATAAASGSWARTTGTTTAALRTGSSTNAYVGNVNAALTALVANVQVGQVYGTAQVNVMKSVKGTTDNFLGQSWTITNYNAITGVSTSNPIVDIVCSTKDANTLWVTDGVSVYQSIDGGTTFTTLPAPPVPTGARIKGMDVGYVGTVPFVFVATANATTAGQDDVFYKSAVQTTWTALGIFANRRVPYTTNMDGVYDVKCSRTFDVDQAVMAVVSAGGDTYLTMRYSGQAYVNVAEIAQWANVVPDIALKTTAGRMDADATARIAIRDTFDADPTGNNLIVIIAVSDGTLRYTGTTPTGDESGRDTYTWSATTLAWSRGTTTAVATGKFTDEDVNSTTYGDGFVQGTMTGAGPVYIRFSKDYATSRNLWAVSNQGVWGPGLCGLSLSTGVAISSTTIPVWKQIALMGTAIQGVVDIEPAVDWFFMVTADTQLLAATPPALPCAGQSLWRFKGSKFCWERIYHVSLATATGVTFKAFNRGQASLAWSTDIGVVVTDWTNSSATTPALVSYSTNGGQSFTVNTTAAPNGVVTASLIRAASTTAPAPNWLLGSTAGQVFNRVGTAWFTRLLAGAVGAVTSFSADRANSANVMAGTDAGEVYLSTDGGANWTALPALVGGGAVTTGFDYNYSASSSATSVVYAANTGGVYRFKVGADSVWTKISGIAGTWPETIGAARSTTNLWGMCPVSDADGTLYAVDKNNSPVSRCVAPMAAVVPATTAPYFETIGLGWPLGTAYGLWDPAGGLMPGLWTISQSLGNVWTYNDQITKPTLTGPANGDTSQSTDSVMLTWNAVPNAFRYAVMLDVTSTFDNPAAFTTSGTSFPLTGLDDSTTYYWKVAVFAQSPALSLFSTTFNFTTNVGPAQWNPFIGGVAESPANGATGVSLTPTFAWNPGANATGYEFQLGTDPTFATNLVSKTGADAVTTTVYSPPVTLDYSTTYYWQVRAVYGSSFSQYGVGVFTTEAAPQPTPTPPTPTPTPTPTPPPVTPTYIWVIIGIGAALVIAVIVLIIRTRRVA